jgi:hypothetical protein
MDDQHDSINIIEKPVLNEYVNHNNTELAQRAYMIHAKEQVDEGDIVIIDKQANGLYQEAHKDRVENESPGHEPKKTNDTSHLTNHQKRFTLNIISPLNIHEERTSNDNEIYDNKEAISPFKLDYRRTMGRESMLSVNGFNQFEFNFESKERRYGKYTISKGKNFFKYRYISQNLFPNVDVKASNPSVSKASLLHAPDDKSVIKYNSLFLQKIEKAIFLFNLKKYEDSYNYLIDSFIINDPEEFAELLLVTQGFDKYIVGDFLSKNKSPNKDFLVLKTYMKKINFEKLPFLESLRFLLSKLNLPKDSALILQIVEVFSDIYYNDNKNLFPDSNSVYLLTSTVLALNTMLHKKIQNMKTLKKEEFEKMNSNIDKKIVDEIYDEIKIKKLDIVHDYNELIYRRLSLKVNPEEEMLTSEKKDRNSTLDDFKIDEKGESMLETLRRGEIFTKYGNKGNPHLRFVKLTDNDTKIIWKEINVCSLLKRNKYLEVRDLKDVYIGSSNSDILQKYNIPLDYDQCCMSIASGKRTLDLRKDDDITCKLWYHAIKYLILKTRSRKEFKFRRTQADVENNNVIISEVWKNEIIPNWKVFRKVIELKEYFKITPGFSMKKKKQIQEKIKKRFFISDIRHRVIEDEQNDIIAVWNYGLPCWVRTKVWRIIVENKTNVTDTLFNKYLRQCKQVNVDDFEKEEEIIKEILIDVHKLSDKFFKEFEEMKREEKELKVILILKLRRSFIKYLEFLHCILMRLSIQSSWLT